MSQRFRRYINSLPDKRVALQLLMAFDRILPTSLDAAIVAQADGTKANATVLNPDASYHVVATSAGALDSVLLPPAHVGEVHLIKNNGANSIRVFGPGTDTVNGVATATGVTQQAEDAILYFCVAEGNYEMFGSSSFELGTFNAIVGGDSSLGITGQAAAQGGAVVVTGGASSTSANAGGAVSLVGGAPGATGIGGAVSMTGAAGLGGAVGGAASVTAGAGEGTGNGAVASVTGGASGGGATGTGGVAKLVGGASAATNGAGGAAQVTGGAGAGTGNGGAVTLTGGASGAGATGNGGATNVTGGAAASTNGNGGSVILTGGAKTGTGVAGMVIERSVRLTNQGTPTAKTTSATLTAAEVLAGIITVNQGGGATSSLTLPLATAMDTAMPDAAAGDAYDFSLINISTVAAEDADILTNTGWTLVGSMAVQSNDAITSKSAGRFRARKTGAGAWTLYRVS